MATARNQIPILDGEHDQWVIEFEVMLGCVEPDNVRTCSISKVPDTLRKGKKEAYTPKIVSIGPFHKGTRTDLQVIEQTKWRYMLKLLDRSTAEEKGPKEKSTTEEKGPKEKLESCIREIRRIDPVVRASYGVDIKLNPEELARIMILDGCFILELLLKLYDHVTKGQPYPADVEDKTLSDLTMLENQIPFIVLEKLLEELSQGNPRYHFPQFDELAKSLFDYHIDADSSVKVFHFLHLIHKSSIYNNKESDSDKITTVTEARQQLQRCARKLRASGIKILAGSCAPATGNIRLSKFVDKFDLNIKFNEYSRILTIPPLHIKEGTEVKWRNLIAWEQSGIEKDYKYTTYALFFSGLICSVHDIELLRTKKIIVDGHDPKMKDEDLLVMFRTIVNGVQKIDSRYSELCENLNAAVDCVKFLRPRMWWHYCRRFLEWLGKLFKKWILDFKIEYLRNIWVFIGVIAATILLGLTIAQTVFAALAN